MRVRSVGLQARLEASTLVPRDFVWIRPRRRSDGARMGFGFWSGLGTITSSVVHPEGAAPVTRTYEGAGSLIEVTNIPYATGLAVQTVEVTMNHIAPGAETIVRDYDLTRAPVEIHRGYLDPVSRMMPDPAELLFAGFADEAPITTPVAGDAGSMRITVAHAMQEAQRANNASTRSDADQRLRDPADAFFAEVATVGDWTIWWGQKEDKDGS